MLVRDYVKKSYLQFFQNYGKLSLLGGVILVNMVTLFILVTSLKQEVLTVTFLDVGQGDAILIRTPSGHDMLVDGGPSRTVVEKVTRVLPYFDRDLDVVIETHPDADHVTGLVSIFDTFKVDHIITSPLSGHTGVFDVLENRIEHEGAQVHIGAQGDVINFGDGVLMYILYPSKNFHGSKRETNDASVSVVVLYGEQSVLLTGDLPSTYEGELIKNKILKKITVYKAGHHGSKYSSGEQLLSYIRPEYVVISAGKDNKYGHPNKEAVDRLAKYTKEIFSTSDHGAIQFTFDGQNADVVFEK